jgi:periplasmic divalent cation tolerance protein
MTDALLVLTTVGDVAAAERLARTLVEERLVACANLLPPLRSIYRWQGKIADDPEVLILFKTQRATYERLQSRILELHPYEVPEVLALPIERGHEVYLQWLLNETIT